MKVEYTTEDFAKAVKNPYFDKMARKSEVTVTHEDYKIFSEVAQKNGVKPEDIMYRCLTIYAQELRDHNE